MKLMTETPISKACVRPAKLFKWTDNKNEYSVLQFLWNNILLDFLGADLSVTVIVAGKPGRGCLHSYSVNALGKDMNPTILLPAMSK